MRVLSTLALAAFLILVKVDGVDAMDSDWILRKDKNDIQIYSQAVTSVDRRMVLAPTGTLTI